MRSLFFFCLVLLAIPIGMALYAANLQSGIPKLQLEEVTSLPLTGNGLPFYEVMSPLPANLNYVPKFEYKKGPPERYLERLALVLEKPGSTAKEEIIYYGRRTLDDQAIEYGAAKVPAPKGSSQEANFFLAAFRLALQDQSPAVPFWQSPFVKIALLQTASTYLENADRILFMDQASNPAFLIFYKESETAPRHADAFFFRRNSLYTIRFQANHNFTLLQPEDYFRKSFLVTNRQEALGFLSEHLSRVHLNNTNSMSLEETKWPLALLSATISVDPSAIDPYFHLAGISALLFKSAKIDANDTELSDTLRNNVLAAARYANDILPKSPKTADIEKLARAITRNIE